MIPDDGVVVGLVSTYASSETACSDDARWYVKSSGGWEEDEADRMALVVLHRLRHHTMPAHKSAQPAWPPAVMGRRLPADERLQDRVHLVRLDPASPLLVDL